MINCCRLVTLFIALLVVGRAFANHDMVVAYHLDPQLQSSAQITSANIKLVQNPDLEELVKSTLLEEFASVKPFSPTDDANYVMIFQLTYGNAFKGEDGYDEYCISIKYETDGEARACVDDLDVAVEDAVEEVIDREERFIEKIASTKRTLNWFTLIDYKKIIVNGKKALYDASQWQSQPVSYSGGINNSVFGKKLRNQKIIDKVKYLTSDYFSQDYGKSVPFFKTKDLIAVAMENPWSAKKHSSLILSLLEKTTKRDRLLPYYLKQAIKVNAPEDILLAFKNKRGSFDEYKDSEGNTPVFHAALNRQPTALKFLVEQGSKVSTKSKLGHTPLQFACIAAATTQSYGTVDYLIEQGLDINYAAPDGTFCLSSAIAYNSLSNNGAKGESVVVELVERGSQISLPKEIESIGVSPLLAALYYGDMKAAEKLIELGANVNQIPEGRDAPLSLAVKHDDYKLAESIIQAGSYMDFVDNNGETALFSAFPDYTKDIGPRHTKMIRLLVANGLDDTIRNHKGLTARETYVNARANYLEEQRRIEHDKRMRELRRERREARAEAKRERARKRRAAEKKKNSFNWGNALQEINKATQKGTWGRGNMTEMKSAVFNSVSAGYDENYDFDHYSNNDYSSSVPYMETVEWARRKGEEHRREIKRLNDNYNKTLASISAGKKKQKQLKAQEAKRRQEHAAREQRLREKANIQNYLADNRISKGATTTTPKSDSKKTKSQPKEFVRLWSVRDVGVDIKKSDFDAGHHRHHALDLAKTMARNKLSDACMARGYSSYDRGTFRYFNDGCSTVTSKVTGKDCVDCYRCEGTGRAHCYTSGYIENINGNRMEGVNGGVTPDRPQTFK